MTSRRLPWLFAALVALALLRWLVPPRAESSGPAASATSEAVVRPSRPASVAPVATAAAWPLPTRLEPSVTSDDIEPAGNAFAVRMPPLPPAPPAPPAPEQVTVSSVVALPAPPPALVEPLPPPPPPFQVIGTWSDGAEFAVFVSSPHGTMIARAGVLLFGEYSVIAVTPQMLSLRHVATKRDLQLTVPRAAGS